MHRHFHPKEKKKKQTMVGIASKTKLTQISKYKIFLISAETSMTSLLTLQPICFSSLPGSK